MINGTNDKAGEGMTSVGHEQPVTVSSPDASMALSIHLLLQLEPQNGRALPIWCSGSLHFHPAPISWFNFHWVLYPACHVSHHSKKVRLRLLKSAEIDIIRGTIGVSKGLRWDSQTIWQSLSIIRGNRNEGLGIPILDGDSWKGMTLHV